MEFSRPALIALIVAHILLVWGGVGILGEGWIRLLLCSASRVPVLSMAFGIAWLISSLSPIVGLVSVKKAKLQPWYVGLVALSMFLIWFGDFMDEIGVFYCDGP